MENEMGLEITGEDLHDVMMEICLSYYERLPGRPAAHAL
jgi:hypothetical protein